MHIASMRFAKSRASLLFLQSAKWVALKISASATRKLTCPRMKLNFGRNSVHLNSFKLIKEGHSWTKGELGAETIAESWQ
jgi:hypothetical protein